MHRMGFIGLLMLGVVALASAQFQKGASELSLSGSLGSYTAKSSSSNFNTSESRNFFFLAVSPGYFVLDGLSVEPEIGMLAIEESEPAWLFLGNLSYTYAIAGSTIAPFIRAGYGVSNAVTASFAPNLLARVSDKLDVGVLSLGGGLKVRISDGAYLRTELNYRKLSWSTEYRGYSYSSTTDHTYSSFGLLVGLSVLL
jgi:hypothetical protein